MLDSTIQVRSNGYRRSIKLSDLDESAWREFGEEMCQVLANQVVDAVRKKMPALSLDSGKVPLGRLPKGIGLNDMELESRTRNCLATLGIEDATEGLESRTLADLAGTRGFGARCLVDLLTSLESFDARINKPCYPDQRVGDVLECEVSALLAVSTTRQIQVDDPRFGRLIGRLIRIAHVPSGRADLKSVVKAIASSSHSAKETVEIVTVAHEIRDLLDRVVRMKLEDELLDVVPRDETERNRKLFWLRHGWDGESRRTLQQLADEFDLTRERVRQICDKLETALASTKPYTPCLERALAYLEERKPIPASDASDELWEQELTERQFSVASLLDAATYLNRSCSLVLKPMGETQMVIDADGAELAEIILEESREAIRHWGVTNVDYVRTLAKKRSGRRVERKLVAHTIQVADGFEWLDRFGGWFWLSGVNPNRLVNQIRKIISVARVISVSDLRTGISRHHRTQGLAPPDRIIMKLCASLGYAIEGETITAPEGLDWRAILGWAEQTIVEVLRANGGICARAELERLCRERGMKMSTFRTYLDRSPLLTRLEDGRYRMRGVRELVS